MSIVSTTYNEYSVLIDVTRLDDMKRTDKFNIDAWLLADIHKISIDSGSESTEGLFVFYANSITLSLKGNWGVAVDAGYEGQCRIDRRARVYVRRDFEHGEGAAVVFAGYVQPDGIAAEEKAPGFWVTKLTCISFEGVMKDILLGKENGVYGTEYYSENLPGRCFDLYKKTTHIVPFGTPIPDSIGLEELEDLKEDVDIYIEPQNFLAPGHIYSGDALLFKRVSIFDSRTLSRNINSDSQTNGARAYYKPIPDGYSRNAPGWYNSGLAQFPFVTLSTLLDEALQVVNKYVDYMGKESGAFWPRFVLPSGFSAPNLVYSSAVPILSGVWHCQVVHNQSRVFAFVWETQFSLKIYEIINYVQLVEVGSYDYNSYFDLAGTWDRGSNYTEIIENRYPSQTWGTVAREAARHPQTYTDFHRDGSMAPIVFGIGEAGNADKIYFGWFATVSGRVVRNDAGGPVTVASFARVNFHPVSFNIVSGHTTFEGRDNEEGGPEVGYNGNFYTNDITWGKDMVEDRFGNFVWLDDPQYQPLPMFRRVNPSTGYFEFYDTLVETGVLESGLAGPRGDACSGPLSIPIGASGWILPNLRGLYMRLNNALIFSGDLFLDSLSFKFEDVTISKLIELVCKLTNTAPILRRISDYQVELDFRKREQHAPVTIRVLASDSVLRYRNRLEQYANKEEAPKLDIPLLEGLPDTYVEGVNDYYRVNYFFKQVVFHTHEVPLVGPHVPDWIEEIQQGDGLQFSNGANLVLASVRKIEKQRLKAIIVSEEVRA